MFVSGQLEKRRERLRACSSFSLTSSGFFTKNPSWQAGQTANSALVTFYGDCVKMCEDFAPNFFCYKRSGCCITTTHRLTLTLSTGNFFYQNQNVYPSPPTLLFPVSPIEDNKGRHFEIVEMIDSESQAVLNRLTEHDLQDALKQ
jgi:hypothetical protein